MAMLTAYLDESGTHDGARAVAIGCYVASLDRWERFSGQWLDVLRDEGIEPPFHMVDFSHGVDRYAPWRDDVVKRARVIARLGSLLRRFYACGRVVEAAPFRDHIATFWNDHRNEPLDPYVFGIRLVTEWIVQRFGGGSHSVRIVIEQGHALMGTAIGQFYFDREYQAGWECLEGMDQGDKKKIPALQGADVLAYESYQLGAKTLWGEGDPYPVRRSLMALLGDRKKIVRIYDREILRDMAVGLRTGRTKPTRPPGVVSLAHLHPDIYQRPTPK